MIRVAINGFGRIGRLVYRIMNEDNDFDVVAINDLTNPEDLAYLLKYDTSHRKYDKNITNTEDGIVVDGKEIKVYKETDPRNLPWKKLDIDIVFECTGHFTSREASQAHIDAGAKKVIISAPAKDVKTVVFNVNNDVLTGNERIISAASCTTNCLAPVLKVINDNFKIKSGFMTTVHAYTNDQATLDIPHKKGIYSRRGRAAAENIVPTSTGAASAIGKVLPELDGKLDGMAMRVPVPDGSVIDLVLKLEKDVTKEEVNKALKHNINETLGYTEEPIVSSDILGDTHGGVVDGLLTNVLTTDDGQLVKVVAWYDNEYSYSNQMVRTAKYFAEKN